MERRPEKELEFRDYRIKYVCLEDHVRVTGFGGTAVEVVIPDRIEELPVTEIAKKVFLSRKKLRRVILPNVIQEIGDWAFAYCDKLEEITFPRRNFSYGRGIFLDCSNLKKIHFVETGQLENEDISVLMAAALTQMDAYYLFEPEMAGSQSWLEKWDFKLRTLIEQDDMDGYTKTVLCGEEDYGSRENDADYYRNCRRKDKVRMAALRMLHPYGLGEELKRYLRNYLQSHCKGSKNGEETWQVVREEHADSRRYYELLGECGCITENNVDAMLQELGDNHAEMKAFLLNYKNLKLSQNDFFDCLSLDS